MRQVILAARNFFNGNSNGSAEIAQKKLTLARIQRNSDGIFIWRALGASNTVTAQVG
jgi:hypothetical protein